MDIKKIIEQFGDYPLLTPRFPNWQKSFVSGPHSPLFKIEHRRVPATSLQDSSQLCSRIHFLPLAEGPPGCVHGGASAALMDELMGVLAWDQDFLSVTEKLQLHFEKLMPLSEEIFGVVWIESQNERNLKLKAGLFDRDETCFVSAEAEFYKLNEKHFQRFNLSKGYAAKS